jgi:hypothetical protein
MPFFTAISSKKQTRQFPIKDTIDPDENPFKNDPV